MQSEAAANIWQRLDNTREESWFRTYSMDAFRFFTVLRLRASAEPTLSTNATGSRDRPHTNLSASKNA